MSLTIQEFSVLNKLKRSGFATHDEIMAALYPGLKPHQQPDRTIIKVLICKLRKKLPGREIKTVWGKGYELVKR